jgi:hypothetical protein
MDSLVEIRSGGKSEREKDRHDASASDNRAEDRSLAVT